MVISFCLQALKDNLNCYKRFMKSSKVVVNDKEGNDKSTCLVETIDPVKTLKSIAESRHIEKPAFCVQVDGGNNKVISTVNIIETSGSDNKKSQKTGLKLDKMKEGGCRRSLILTAIDEVHESRETLKKCLEPVLPVVRRDDAYLSGDHKAMADIYGKLSLEVVISNIKCKMNCVSRNPRRKQYPFLPRLHITEI